MGTVLKRTRPQPGVFNSVHGAARVDEAAAEQIVSFDLRVGLSSGCACRFGATSASTRRGRRLWRSDRRGDQGGAHGMVQPRS